MDGWLGQLEVVEGRERLEVRSGSCEVASSLVLWKGSKLKLGRRLGAVLCSFGPSRHLSSPMGHSRRISVKVTPDLLCSYTSSMMVYL